MDDYARLGPRETAAGRAFTDPGESAPDLAAAARMLAEIQHQVRHGEPVPARARPLVAERREARGRLHRAILFAPRRIGDGRELFSPVVTVDHHSILAVAPSFLRLPMSRAVDCPQSGQFRSPR